MTTFDTVAVPADSATQNRKPTTIGPYTIRELLGHSPMGMTYAATHNSQKRRVALRVLPPLEIQDRRSIARFAQDVATASDLEHPNVQRVIDAGEQDGTHYIALEIVDGSNLLSILKTQGPLSVAATCEIARQTAAGLQGIFEAGLIHRDIKPSKLVLTEKGVISILGVGVTALRPDTKLATLAAAGMLEDTPDYLAPEYITDPDSADIRADIYSLGCTLYHLLTGTAPFTDADFATPMAKIDGHQSETPVPIQQQLPDISPDLAAVIHRMMAKDPAKRFQTPGEIVGAMCSWASGEQLPSILQSHQKHKTTPHEKAPAETPTQTSEAKPEETPAKKSTFGWLVSVLLVALVGGLAALGLNSLKPSAPAIAPTTPEGTPGELQADNVPKPAPFIQSDRYHTHLAEDLRTQYGLTNGKWVLTPTELGNAGRAISYGHKLSRAVVSDKPFANVVQMKVVKPSKKPWDAAYFVPDVTSIEPGDSVLIVVWMRAAYPKIGNVCVFVEDPTTYNKEVYQKVQPTQQWQQFLIPFEAGEASKRSVGVHLASQQQLLELGGLALVNYGKTIPFTSLPKNLHERSVRRVQRGK